MTKEISIFKSIKKTMEKNEPCVGKASKLLIDKPSDFLFHAAYMAYSKTWDENASEEARTKLNRIMLSFSDSGSSFFYSQLNEFRVDVNPDFHGRSMIRSQKKRAWRKEEQKKARMSRHRK